MPLLLVLSGTLTRSPQNLQRAFAVGILSGVVYFTGTLYWITEVMVTYGGLTRPVGVVVNGLLVAYLSLFPGLFAVGIATLRARLGTSALLLAPAVWVTTELGRMYLLGGFPWELLGYSQTTVLPVAQLASVLGVHGLSALVASVSAAVAYAVVSSERRRWVAAVVAVGVVGATAGWGAWRLGTGDLLRQGTPLRVGLLQGNIEQDAKWNPAMQEAIIDRYLMMSREAADRGAQLVIWPESSTPFAFEDDHEGSRAIRRLARDTGTYLLIGSTQTEPAVPLRYYNAAFLVNQEGETAAVYRKMHLVPFGEYVPLRRALFFVSPLVETVGDFSPGTAPVMLPVGDHLASTAICYEVIYPGLIRRFVTRGSELLTTITNDAWYGHSSAPYQHFEQAALRAVEQGRYLVRAANTGISGVVDPYGRVVARTGLFERDVITGDVRLLTGRTIYGRIGDLFAYLCVAVTLAALLVPFLRLPRTGKW